MVLMKENLRERAVGDRASVGKEPVNETITERQSGLMERGGSCFSPTALFSYNVANQFPSQNALCERFYIVCFAASRQPSKHAD